MSIRPLGLAVVEQPSYGGCNHVHQINLARPGREQPKFGRSALRGVRVRVKRQMDSVKTMRRTPGPAVHSYGILTIKRSFSRLVTSRFIVEELKRNLKFLEKLVYGVVVEV